MNKLYIVFFVVISLLSCLPEEVQFDDLVESISFPQAGKFIADGESSIKVEVRFKEDVDISDIKAVAIVDPIYMSHADSEDEEYTLEPEVFGNGRVRSEFTVISTTRAGKFNIRFDVNQFQRIYPLESFISIPHSIIISKSSNSVQSGFIGEVTIEGLILNEFGRKASQGVKVKFTDVLSDGSPAGGIFRAENLVSNSDSKVSTIYSPGIISEDQFITIKVEVLDNNGNLTGINNSTEIFVY
ncbi:MAG: hypothetical protein ACSHW7_02290 [Patiriisocius sp.]|uniref:hypothetical protein n=1 Tax=Patiriisocius sp. TaxID=2822396 RepID=UPI003EF1FA60